MADSAEEESAALMGMDVETKALAKPQKGEEIGVDAAAEEEGFGDAIAREVLADSSGRQPSSASPSRVCKKRKRGGGPLLAVKRRKGETDSSTRGKLPHTTENTASQLDALRTVATVLGADAAGFTESCSEGAGEVSGEVNGSGVAEGSSKAFGAACERVEPQDTKAVEKEVSVAREGTVSGAQRKGRIPKMRKQKQRTIAPCGNNGQIEQDNVSLQAHVKYSVVSGKTNVEVGPQPETQQDTEAAVSCPIAHCAKGTIRSLLRRASSRGTEHNDVGTEGLTPQDSIGITGMSVGSKEEQGVDMPAKKQHAMSGEGFIADNTAPQPATPRCRFGRPRACGRSSAGPCSLAGQIRKFMVKAVAPVSTLPAEGVVPDRSTALWSDRHVPRMGQEIPRKVWVRLTEWLRHWGRPGRCRRGMSWASPRAALVVGPPGSGKTFCTRLVARRLRSGWDGRRRRIHELSAWDEEGRRFVENFVRRQMIVGAEAKSKSAGVIVILDIDGVGDAFKKLLSKAVRLASSPLVLVCNEGTIFAEDKIMCHCLNIKSPLPTEPEAARWLAEVAARERLAVAVQGGDGVHAARDTDVGCGEGASAWSALAEACGRDLRRAVNAMQLLGSRAADMADSVALTTPFAVCRLLLAGPAPSTEILTVADRLWLASLDEEVLAPLVQANYLRPCDVVIDEDDDVLGHCADAAESLAVGDVFCAAAAARGEDLGCDSTGTSSLLSVVFPCTAVARCQVSPLPHIEAGVPSEQLANTVHHAFLARLAEELGSTRSHVWGLFHEWRASQTAKLRADSWRLQRDFKAHVTGCSVEEPAAGESLASQPVGALEPLAIDDEADQVSATELDEEDDTADEADEAEEGE